MTINEDIYTSIYICIHIMNTDLSTCRLVDCRLVDMSTCRPSTIVNNKDPVRVRVSVWLGLGLG